MEYYSYGQLLKNNNVKKLSIENNTDDNQGYDQALDMVSEYERKYENVSVEYNQCIFKRKVSECYFEITKDKLSLRIRIAKGGDTIYGMSIKILDKENKSIEIRCLEKAIIKFDDQVYKKIKDINPMNLFPQITREEPIYLTNAYMSEIGVYLIFSENIFENPDNTIIVNAKFSHNAQTMRKTLFFKMNDYKSYFGSIQKICDIEDIESNKSKILFQKNNDITFKKKLIIDRKYKKILVKKGSLQWSNAIYHFDKISIVDDFDEEVYFDNIFEKLEIQVYYGSKHRLTSENFRKHIKYLQNIHIKKIEYEKILDNKLSNYFMILETTAVF